MKLNCDLGESFGNWSAGMDQDVMPHIDMANIACGFHAADPLIMQRTVALAKQHGVRVGAHPAYPDLVGFGRRSLACSFDEIYSMVLYQLGALQGICQSQGQSVSYVKPHGALYNDMMQQPDVLRAILQAVADFTPRESLTGADPLPVLVMATADNTQQEQLAAAVGIPLMFEAFADRAYDEQGRLVSRRILGAVYHDPQQVVQQALAIAQGYEVSTLTPDVNVLLKADTLCVHGDNDASLQAVKAIRRALNAR
ncbi:5-oxoprolinase subunit PxpA [Oceanospirillum linum]|uniref:5-oxoprolinase subunit A n=1 Tax=Oceanospirillum linum TaxID=966 RepID=A0A1T1HEC4_OCELI|nr:5-oxoprolinase subunit PxpA [Oceanospirillum linum]OOV88165.1 hypothetical protein BTA35_0201080 [Oceanospirillum linum]SEF45771.1 UPF0271 protein [Oleiphilus messinensis]SMP01847.1 UPF0271 protein [Oceanospirillum linum]